MVMEVSRSTEQDTPDFQSMEEAAATAEVTATASQPETREPSQPMISSNFPVSAQNTSSLSCQVYPRLMQGTPRATQGSSKTSFGSGKMLIPNAGPQGHPPNLHWTGYGEQQTQLRAKKKLDKWRLLATLLTALALPLFFFIFYWK